MKVHFIAIGGSAMHNLAIALTQNGYTVSGSDDEILDPSLGRLKKYDLLPETMGWDANRIHSGLNAVIVGMHARIDNPELIRAKELKLKIYSYPEYIYEQTKNKKRIVIGGSHGKTTITSMILHVMNFHGIKHDYLVGAQLEGYECMVGFDSESQFAVIEGDEYLSSPDDRRPKFHLYFPDIAVISGIAWDHINVFPTFEIYVEQFSKFIDLIEENGSLIYYSGDSVLKSIAEKHGATISKISYSGFSSRIENGITSVTDHEGKTHPLQIFGEHNLQNLEAAFHVCGAIGISSSDFFAAVQSFKGAAKRLELVKKNDYTNVYKDFAHSPSKLKATTSAMKKQFPERKLVACMELHTFSSLNEDFLKQYAGAMDEADESIVYFNPHTIEHKKLKPITTDQVKEAFGNQQLIVFQDSSVLVNELLSKKWKNANLLLMSSGNFDGVNFSDLAEKIVRL